MTKTRVFQICYVLKVVTFVRIIAFDLYFLHFNDISIFNKIFATVGSKDILVSSYITFCSVNFLVKNIK